MRGSDDGERVDPPRRWVEALYDSEEEVRDVLDGIREAHLLGESETVRERLRAFSRAEKGVFRAAALATLDVEAFYDELESQYDDGEAAPAEELRRFGAEYGRLADEFELVYSERIHDLRNPMPTLRRGFRYSSGIELPLLDYDIYSGDVELCRFVHPPSQALMLARSIVANTTRLLEQVEENDDGIAATERELLTLVCEDLEEEVAGLDEFVGAGEREEDPEEADEVEPYQDWSVY